MHTLSIASLVEDLNLYPRNHVDDAWVSDLVRALQSGATLPPIVACAATRRIVDGVHRSRAMLRHFGADATTTVDLRTYSSDAALFEDAVSLNSTHGRKLDRHDQARIVLKFREFKVDDQRISVLLHIPEPQVQTLSVRVVYSQAGEAVPSKRGLSHMQGETLTDAQLRVVGSIRSAEVGRLCMELSQLLDSELVDRNDPTISDRLQSLQRSITIWLQSMAA